MQQQATRGAELLGVLAGIPSTDPEYGQWWGGEDGQWLYQEITERIGTRLVTASATLYGVCYEPEDVAHTAVTLLRRQEVHPYIVRSSDPWGYLGSMLKRQLNRDAGAYFRVEMDSDDVRSLSYVDDTDGPSMVEGVEQTIERLKPMVGEDRYEALTEAVWYFAENGHTRLSHLYSRAAQDPLLTSMGLSRSEILAIANAVLGSRPTHSHNSLLAGFLTSEEFNPSASIPHRLALKKFHSRMTTADSAQAA